MDSSIIITFAIPLFFGLILIEFFYGVITKQNNYRINDAITSMSLGLISRFVPILGLGFQYVVYKAAAEHYNFNLLNGCLLYTSPSPRDRQKSRMPSSA